MSFFKIFFRAWENTARLFFNFSYVIFATLVKFFFVGFDNSLVFLLKSFTCPTYAFKFMLVNLCYWLSVYSVFIWSFYIFFHSVFIESVLFRAIFLCNEYVFFKLHHYACLLNSRFLLVALIIFLYFDWSVSLVAFCFYSKILSKPFLCQYVHGSSGGRLVLYSCSSLVAIFRYLSGYFICIGYR